MCCGKNRKPSAGKCNIGVSFKGIKSPTILIIIIMQKVAVGKFFINSNKQRWPYVGCIVKIRSSSVQANDGNASNKIQPNSGSKCKYNGQNQHVSTKLAGKCARKRDGEKRQGDKNKN